MRVSPATQLVAAMLVFIAAIALVIHLVAGGPWLGLQLAGNEPVRIVATTGPAAAIPAPANLVRLGDIPITARDLVDDPDQLPTFAERDAFFERQARIRRALTGKVAIVTDRGTTVVEPAASRPLASFPASFWFQLACGAFCYLLAIWVVVLGRRDLPSALFGISGVGVAFTCSASAAYTVREIALDARLFRALDAINHLGASISAASLLVILLSYPARVASRPVQLAVFIGPIAWWFLSDVAGVMSIRELAYDIPIGLEVLVLLALPVVQWRKAKGDPHARACLAWLGLATGASLGLFLLAWSLPLALHRAPLVTQAYSFGFFVVYYAGFAFSLHRFRLFDLEAIVPLALLWFGGAAAFLGVDAALAWAVGDGRVSLLVALALCGFGYLPVRTWLWSRFSSRLPSDAEVLDAVLDVTFATAEKRAERWQHALEVAFDPRTMTPAADTAEHAQRAQDGVALLVPAVRDVPALELTYRRKGRALFGPREERLAQRLVDLVRHADLGREQFERGAREERRRIARDLHDDLGARLLTTLHESSLERTRTGIRRAMTDMRDIVHVLSAEPTTAETLLADLRHETAERLDAAGLKLTWPPVTDDLADIQLTAAAARSYSSMLRELVSNVLRHADARTVSVQIERRENLLVTTIEDDGTKGYDGAGGGFGIPNVEARITALGGDVTIARAGAITRARVTLPVAS